MKRILCTVFQTFFYSFLAVGLVSCIDVPAQGDQLQSVPIPETSIPKQVPTETRTVDAAISIPTLTLTVAPHPIRIDNKNASHIKLVRQVSQPNPFHVDWSSDSSMLGAVSQVDSNQATVILYRSKILDVFSSTVLQQPYILLDYSPNGRIVALSTDFTAIDLRDMTSGKSLRTLAPGIFTAATFSPDGKLLAVCSGEMIKVSIYDVSSGTLLRTVTGYDTAAPVYDAFLTQDDGSLVWHSRSNIRLMRLFDQVFGPDLEHEDFVIAIDLSQDMQMLAAATDGTIGNEIVTYIQLWDPASGKALGRLLTGQDMAQSISFSPDGTLLAAGAGKKLFIWDTTSQQLLFEYEIFDAVNSLAFAPDGMTLAVASADGTLSMWQTSE